MPIKILNEATKGRESPRGKNRKNVQKQNKIFKMKYNAYKKSEEKREKDDS